MSSGFRTLSIVLVVAVATVVSASAGELPRAATEADFMATDSARVELGRLLFFDKILSGNENISCASCHHPLAASGDGLSLPVGEGGAGLGATRDTGSGADAIHERVPRNAPHLFNLGALEFEVMFDDGRVELMPSHPTGFRSPADLDLPPGLESVLAVQAMFPVTSAAEMAGQAGENPIADAADALDLAGPTGVWAQLADRLRANDEYVALFTASFDDVVTAADITYVHAANAIAEYEAAVFRADQSPFDRSLRGDDGALSPNQETGMALFYGDAGCDSCHSGTFQTDHGFHALGVPQIGPGKGDDLPGQSAGVHDFGRERVTDDRADRMRFRTPSLRNVALTGPWGHDGAYDDLEAMVRHHMRPRWSLLHYDRAQLMMPSRADLDVVDMAVMDDPRNVAAVLSAIEIPVNPRPDAEVAALLDFLHALTDPSGYDLRRDVPKRVPSGLPVYD